MAGSQSLIVFIGISLGIAAFAQLAEAPMLGRVAALVRHETSSPQMVPNRLATRKVAAIRRMVKAAARKHHFSEDLILSIIQVESGFQPWAVSPQGALGLMQIMPETGQWLAEMHRLPWTGPAQLLDEETNITMGVLYLSFLRARYGGDLEKMLSAYNRGPAKVDEELARGHMGTLSYYQRVRNIK